MSNDAECKLTISQNRCVYKGCSNGKHNDKLFRFPSAVDPRQAIWVKNCGNERMQTWSRGMLWRAGLCSKHFTPNSFVSGKRGKLTSTALPVPWFKESKIKVEPSEDVATGVFIKTSIKPQRKQVDSVISTYYNKFQDNRPSEDAQLRTQGDAISDQTCSKIKVEVNEDAATGVFIETSIESQREQVDSVISPCCNKFQDIRPSEDPQLRIQGDAISDQTYSRIKVEVNEDLATGVFIETSIEPQREQVAAIPSTHLNAFQHVSLPKHSAVPTQQSAIPAQTRECGKQHLSGQNNDNTKWPGIEPKSYPAKVKMRPVNLSPTDALKKVLERVMKLEKAHHKLQRKNDVLHRQVESLRYNLKKVHTLPKPETITQNNSNLCVGNLLNTQNCKQLVVQTMVKLLFHETRAPYSPEEKDLAKQLYFHSASAYSRLRKAGCNLPGESFVRRW